VSRIDGTVAKIPPLDTAAMQAARARQDILTKPQGSLGRLEEISIRIAGIQGRPCPEVSWKAVFVMAGDHGCVAEGVSAYPQEVTPQMVANFAAGGAAINVLARHVGVRVIVVDMGVAGECRSEKVLSRKVAPGTRNLTLGPAMSAAEARQCLETGIELLESELSRGLDLVGIGDMGIGNTTPSAAIIAAITRRSPRDVTGRGTGIDDARLATKISVIERALAVNEPDPSDALDVLAKVGGFEIGGLAGVILAAAAYRIPVVIDGVISSAAALIATTLAPQSRDYLTAGHLSVEPGHGAALEYMKLEPVLDLGMRLGEGTGGVLAMSIIEAAVKTLNEMATFHEAGVSEALDEV